MHLHSSLVFRSKRLAAMRGVFVCGATRFSDADASHSAGGGVHAPAVYIDNGACGHFRVHCSPETGFNPDLVGAAYT